MLFMHYDILIKLSCPHIFDAFRQLSMQAPALCLIGLIIIEDSVVTLFDVLEVLDSLSF